MINEPDTQSIVNPQRIGFEMSTSVKTIIKILIKELITHKSSITSASRYLKYRIQKKEVRIQAINTIAIAPYKY